MALKRENYQITSTMRKLLKRRGIESEEDVQEYLSPIPRLTYDPFLMKGMREAVDTVLRHIDSGDRICIYGDYDADGVTSVTLLTEYLGFLTDNVTFYIPSRFGEGYGLNNDAIKRIHDDGVGLIITVDCGCVAAKEVEYIKSLGMNVIVTDHHEVDERKPDCILLDPKQDGETYPFRYLCGCGVAFKLAQAVGRERGIPKVVLNQTLDITGIATIADVVPLTGENRTLVKYGFDRIRKLQRPGLVLLMREIGIDSQRLRSYNIAFGIGPHLNSAGRLSTADIAVKMLSAKDMEKASDPVAELIRLNGQRKKLQAEIYDGAVRTLEDSPMEPIIFYNAGNANEGITGIVAGKLKEKYSRPVIIIAESEEEGFFKGTGRSVSKVDLIGLISENAQLFARFGGHAAACGFTISAENVNALHDSLIASMRQKVEADPSILDDRPEADLVIEADDVTMDLAREITLMEPFGAENPMPLFEISDLSVRYVRSMGSEGRYRKYICESSTGKRLECVVFDDSVCEYRQVSGGDVLTVLGEIGINEWRGKSSVQITIKEIIERY